MVSVRPSSSGSETYCGTIYHLSDRRVLKITNVLIIAMSIKVLQSMDHRISAQAAQQGIVYLLRKL